MKTNFKNLADFLAWAKDEKTCRDYFASLRFTEGDFCPLCKHDKIFRFKDGRYRCAKCRKDFTIKTGTIFGESKIPLRKWFIAIYLLTTHKKGISSVELAQHVGVSQKTAWFMDHRIREAMKQDGYKLSGIIETDETYISGCHNRKDGFRKKKVVFGMTERGGKTKAYQIPGRYTGAIFSKIQEHVDPKAFLMTDEAAVYKKLPKIGYRRGAINHSKKEWARGEINTNSIESFWALFKRGHHGTYHSMSKKHLQRYIDEFVFRFNTRQEAMAEKFENLVQKVSECGTLSYKELCNKGNDQNGGGSQRNTSPFPPPSTTYLVPSLSPAIKAEAS